MGSNPWRYSQFLGKCHVDVTLSIASADGVAGGALLRGVAEKLLAYKGPRRMRRRMVALAALLFGVLIAIDA